MIHPEDAEELLAGIATEKLDSADVRRAQLELERKVLLTRITRLINIIDRKEIERVEAGDHDMSVRTARSE